ncbi:hypothetical protein NBRC116583_03610 [Arenicella sp. 4NH20-0111]|uniref:hypothetical protein n=1 Tax=Arenicella sp. 4NH20-0111 TaxID=3127648 RepID=UPI0031075C86
MNINITQLGDWVSLVFYVLGIVFGGLVVNLVAKQDGIHVARKTAFGTLLAFVPPLCLIYVWFLLKSKQAES